MSRLPRVGFLAVMLLGSTLGRAAAQDWRTVSHRRQVVGEDRVKVEVQFGVGELRIEPASSGTLYRSSIRYDARVFTPIHEYRGGVLRIGVDGSDKRIHGNFQQGGRMDLALTPDVPLDLDLTFGAVEAALELGGLRLSRLGVSTGASETRLRFSKPNPIRMQRLSIDAGAAELQVDGLGNANVDALRVKGGVGDLTLDFTGDWRGDTHAEIELGLGALTLRIPHGVGVKVTKSTLLMGFDSEGLVKRGDAYYSTDWDAMEHRLVLDISGALGSIDVRWVDANDGP
ncbi:MAG TPA: hypothetical protein VF158_03715 [Longimicrobiales bacterium]